MAGLKSSFVARVLPSQSYKANQAHQTKQTKPTKQTKQNAHARHDPGAIVGSRRRSKGNIFNIKLARNAEFSFSSFSRFSSFSSFYFHLKSSLLSPLLHALYTSPLAAICSVIACRIIANRCSNTLTVAHVAMLPRFSVFEVPTGHIVQAYCAFHIYIKAFHKTFPFPLSK